MEMVTEHFLNTQKMKDYLTFITYVVRFARQLFRYNFPQTCLSLLEKRSFSYPLRVVNRVKLTPAAINIPGKNPSHQ